MQIYEWYSEIAESVPTPTPVPTPGPGMRFIDIEAYKIKEIEGPLEPSARIKLVNKNWIFEVNGAVEEKMCIDVDELDFVGNIKKNLFHHITDTLSPGSKYMLALDIENKVDFSQRYETADKLYLAISIWGKDTETKPSPPYSSTSAILSHGSDVSIWGADILSEIPPPAPGSDMRFYEDIKDHVVRKLIGPLKPGNRPVLVNDYWHVINKGLASDILRVDIDEIDSGGGFIKTLAVLHANKELKGGEIQRVGGNITNLNDFSRRYELSEKLYLSMAIWGQEYEKKPQRYADVKFEDDIFDHEVNQILGPFEKTARIPLLWKGWHFMFNGMNPEIIRIDIDELDVESNFIKAITSYQTSGPISYGKHEMIEDIRNTANFSQRYEIGDTLFLAATLWGKDTETKPDIPPSPLINVIRWSYKVR